MPAPSVHIDKDFRSPNASRIAVAANLGRLSETSVGFLLGLAGAFTLIGWALAYFVSPVRVLEWAGLI